MNTKAVRFWCSQRWCSHPASAFRRTQRDKGQSKSRSCVLLLVISLFLAPVSSRAQHSTESQVKAAYLYNFGKFVRWQLPRITDPDSIEICVYGKDPFGKILDSTVAGESIDGRKITVRRPAKVQDAAPCSILFISSSEEYQLGSILEVTEHFGILTVSDMPHFAERGGVIGFVMLSDRIRFELNRSAAERSHLVLSSDLLKVASKVIEPQASKG